MDKQDELAATCTCREDAIPERTVPAYSVTSPATQFVTKTNALAAESEQSPAPYEGGCVAVFHNVCGRRTIRKSCYCQICVVLSAAIGEDIGGGRG